ncbi:MAG TPA: phosphate ABC transporter substrate-binding protein PstS [Burkholderiales bacterium]|nr:phosphate ABC transporter substrate-binding protein PstS [Burkholderiales bacterium]
MFALKSRNLIITAAIAAMTVSASAFATDITGAGATFPYPIYSKWAEAYKAKTGIGLNYQSIGSGGGIKQINANTVDFGASDMPLKPDVLEKDGLMQFPAVMGGEVLSINIPGIRKGEMKLDGKIIADIYLGKIKNWNDPAIRALNKGVKLPDMKITVVHRSDGSGTTFIFTNYLSKVSKEWESKIGMGTSVDFPVGVGGKGNEGVASYVQRIKGSIGYVEYAYALQNNMVYTQLESRDGTFLMPTSKTFQAAAAGADWAHAPGFYEILTNEEGKDSWPITGATFILMHTVQEKPANAKEVLKFYSWAYDNGGKMAEELVYVPMPGPVVKLIRQAWHDKIKDTHGNSVWN